MVRGRFITLEGGEGTGKSTQVHLLATTLSLAGITVHTTREPGGSTGAEHIRELLVRGEVLRWDPMTESLLHFAARRDHLEKTVRPALARGEWVVCDRFADSTMAYQGFGMGLGRQAVESLYRLVVETFAPDLTLILDLPVEEGLRRAAARAGTDTRYERMDASFHERVRGGFQEIAAIEPGRCVLIDARPDVDAVHRAICAAVSERLGISLS
jgi:dTMP kinase